jgi:hypothetical protein
MAIPLWIIAAIRSASVGVGHSSAISTPMTSDCTKAIPATHTFQLRLLIPNTLLGIGLRVKGL